METKNAKTCKTCRYFAEKVVIWNEATTGAMVPFCEMYEDMVWGWMSCGSYERKKDESEGDNG